MSESDTNQLLERIEILWKSSIELTQSSILVRGVGYGLLVLFLFDLVYLFIPPGFMNPSWEFQTFGAIVERVTIPLVALVLIFWGGKNGRLKLELPLLKMLSKLSLVVGVIFLLAIPLGIFNTIRLDRQINMQINQQLEQGKSQIKQIQNRLENVTTQAQMQELINQLNGSGSTPKIVGQISTVKKDLTSSLAQGERSLSTQAENLQKSQRLNLMKNSVKWNLGSLIAGALFIWIWLLTNWANIPKSKR